MKKEDFFLVILLSIIFLPFFLFEDLLLFYKTLTNNHGILMSFLKFSILATIGEIIGLRIRSGKYLKSGFGIIPKMIVWGCLGIMIKISFIIFATGTLNVLNYLGFEVSKNILNQDFSFLRILTAFSISFFMNIIFAPVMMTIHKITDLHIEMNNGTISGFFSKVQINTILKNINWDIMWGFVLKKTIPLFWIPAHTITFLLPSEFRVLFAALLGIILGILLAFASNKK